MNKLSNIYIHPIKHYENVELTNKSRYIILHRKCWFCDSKCYSYVAICNNCKLEKALNSSKK